MKFNHMLILRGGWISSSKSHSYMHYNQKYEVDISDTRLQI